MAITPAQIDLWRALPSETQRLEFKEAKTGFDNQKLYKYCVALANEGGGHLLLGVADKPKGTDRQRANPPGFQGCRCIGDDRD